MGIEIDIDESFPRSYEVEQLLDLPNSPRTKFVELGRGGPIVRVTRHDVDRYVVALPWSVNAKFYSWPCPDKMLAVPSTFLINTSDPEASSCLDGFEGHSLHYVLPIPPTFMIVGHCCELFCYNSGGLAWKSENLFCCTDPELSSDGQRLLVVAHKHGVDAGDKPTAKWLDLSTGERLA